MEEDSLRATLNQEISGKEEISDDKLVESQKDLQRWQANFEQLKNKKAEFNRRINVIDDIKMRYKKAKEKAVLTNTKTPSITATKSLIPKGKQKEKKPTETSEEKTARLEAFRAEKARKAEEKRKEEEQRKLDEQIKEQEAIEAKHRLEASIKAAEKKEKEQAAKENLKTDTRLKALDENLHFLGELLEFIEKPDRSAFYLNSKKFINDFEIEKFTKTIQSNALVLILLRIMQCLTDISMKYRHLSIFDSEQTNFIRNALMHTRKSVDHKKLLEFAEEVYAKLKGFPEKIADPSYDKTQAKIIFTASAFNEDQINESLKAPKNPLKLLELIKNQLVNLKYLYQIANQIFKNKQDMYIGACTLLHQAMMSCVVDIGESLQYLSDKKDDKQYPYRKEANKICASLIEAMGKFEFLKTTESGQTENVFMLVRKKAGHRFTDDDTQQVIVTQISSSNDYLFEPLPALTLLHVAKDAGKLLKSPDFKSLFAKQPKKSQSRLLAAHGMLSSPDPSAAMPPSNSAASSAASHPTRPPSPTMKHS